MWLQPHCLQAQQENETDADSLKQKTLQEVVVEGQTHIETPEKVVLLPTKLQKKHAANSLELLDVMQVPGLRVSLLPPSISTTVGREIVVCINGEEVGMEEIRTLRAARIKKMEYTRTPSGRYVGKAGVLNLITDEIESGGNMYLSATQGWGHTMGNYLAFADYGKDKQTFSLTLFHDRSLLHGFREGTDWFRFSDASILHRQETSLSARKEKQMQGGRIKFTSAGKRHSMSGTLQLLHNRTPDESQSSKLVYWGKTEDQTERTFSSNSKGISPSARIDYMLKLPHNQSLDFTANASYGYNSYHRLYREDGQDTLYSKATEDNFSLSGSARYGKKLKNNMSLTFSLLHSYKNYRDAYSGSSVGQQHLITQESMGLGQLSQSLKNIFYYMSLGVSNMAVSLNRDRQNYLSPTAFYGGTYTFDDNHSASINGHYTHTLFDPSLKNSMVIPVSFFEVQVGNPSLRPMKVLSNMFSYNGILGKSSIEAGYNSYIYFNNIVGRYLADADKVYMSRVNDGNFYGNMLSLSYGYTAWKDRFNIMVTGIYEYNVLHGSLYHLSKGIIRWDASGSLMVGNWYFSLDYAAPYTALNNSGPYLMRQPSVYKAMVRWSCRAWTLAFSAKNVFSRFGKTATEMDYGVSRQAYSQYNEEKGRSLQLTVTYNVGYGKKREPSENVNMEKKMDNAIMAR